MFQMYARGDEGWRAGLAWEHVPFVPIETSWFSSWWFYVLAMVAVAGIIWWWRGG